MLQQTQVARVLEVFESFMDRFPDPSALAVAADKDLMQAWQGLGYYRRARHLRSAARMIVDAHDGEVPLDVEALLALPGVGRYTAGSIASIVGGIRAPIVDGNITRFLARLDLDDASVESQDFSSRMWSRSALLVEASGNPAVFNEGMMEFGAMVCTPVMPSCEQCPVQRFCKARRHGMTNEVPKPKQRKARQSLHVHSVIIRRNGRVLMEQRPDAGLWAGMWQPPSVESARRMSNDQLLAGLSLPMKSIQWRSTIERVLTHRLVHMHVHVGTLVSGARIAVGVDKAWVHPSEFDQYPISNATHAALAEAMAD